MFSNQGKISEFDKFEKNQEKIREFDKFDKISGNINKMCIHIFFY